ncbi:MAG: hypothetical protein FJX57_07730 [Alphaproteobacteria bacterium]|nr:hypothetical protein [Alphaproteobacteria bacterium]
MALTTGLLKVGDSVSNTSAPGNYRSTIWTLAALGPFLLGFVIFVGAANRRLNDAGAGAWIKAAVVPLCVVASGGVLLLVLGLAIIGPREGNAVIARSVQRDARQVAERVGERIVGASDRAFGRHDKVLRTELENVEKLLQDGIITPEEHARMRSNLIEKYALDRSLLAKHNVEVVRRD